MDYISSLNSSALDPNTPTLFELFSARELDALIGPSIRYIITFYAQRHPRYLLRLATKFDELYVFLFGIVEYYHLKNWNSTFTEKFYGLKRTRVLNSGAISTLPRTRVAASDYVEKSLRLSKKQVWASVLMTMLGPYIKEKAEVKYQRLQARALVHNLDSEYQRVMAAPSSRTEASARRESTELLISEDTNTQIHTKREKMQVFVDYWFYKLYPYISAGHSAITLIFYLMYLFNKASTATCLSDWLLGIQYSRMGQFDYMLADERAGKNMSVDPQEKDDDETPLIGKLINLVKTRQGYSTIKNGIFSVLSYALPTSMFMLKFLEWWSASDVASKIISKSARGLLEGNLPVLRNNERTLRSADKANEKQEVKSRKKVDNVEKLVRDTSLCPLCGSLIANPTVIESGVVCCYPCIYKYLESAPPPTESDVGGRCPVTGARLLQCQYNSETETWEVGGLRRLMV